VELGSSRRCQRESEGIKRVVRFPYRVETKVSGNQRGG
jgi:hypothetical protein